MQPLADWGLAIELMQSVFTDSSIARITNVPSARNLHLPCATRQLREDRRVATTFDPSGGCLWSRYTAPVLQVASRRLRVWVGQNLPYLIALLSDTMSKQVGEIAAERRFPEKGKAAKKGN